MNFLMLGLNVTWLIKEIAGKKVMTLRICGMWLTAIKAVGLWLNLMTGDAHECHQDIESYFALKKLLNMRFLAKIQCSFIVNLKEISICGDILETEH